MASTIQPAPTPFHDDNDMIENYGESVIGDNDDNDDDDSADNDADEEEDDEDHDGDDGREGKGGILAKGKKCSINSIFGPNMSTKNEGYTTFPNSRLNSVNAREFMQCSFLSHVRNLQGTLF